MKILLIRALFALCFFFVPLTVHSETANEPLAVYLTWVKDPTTTMAVQWVTPQDQTGNDVYYRKENDNNWQIAVGSYAPFPFNDPFFLHRANLSNLTPDSAYVFRLGWNSPEYKFKTMPQNLDKPIRFVVGGDMYHDDIKSISETSLQAAMTNPHFALVGGDIAYSAAKTPQEFKEMSKRWLTWLMIWTDCMVTQEGYLIPMIIAIGNHDTDYRKMKPPEQIATYFYFLFPFPGPRGYNVLDFGNYLTILSLDTGHTHPIEGDQTFWLYQALQQRPHIPNKIVFYHVPAYPGVHDFKIEAAVLIRKNWVPLFEQMGISTVFEHHGHAYKRTFPIYQDKINSDRGILYLGDGAWGVKKPREPKKPSKEFYLAVTAQERHFILATITEDANFYEAINFQGITFDRAVQELKVPAQL